MVDYAADISTNDYLFREEITITETGGEDRTSFSVKLLFTSSNFNFTLAKSNGHDIRIAEASNGTRVLNIWVASWSDDAEVGTVWLKIPNLLANEDKTLYVYWGNRNAFDSSDMDEIGFLFADGFDSVSLDQTKWLSSGISVYLDSVVVINTDGYIESKGLPLSGVVNWIIEEGVYVYSVGASTTETCHRYRFYGTENNFGFNFYREGSKDIRHNAINSSTWVDYNGVGRGFDASGYSENYIGYKEPTDRVYQGMSNRPTLSDYDNSWERKVYGDTRITYFRIYGRDTTAAHQIGVDWIIVREYFVVDPYTVDTSSLYVPYETVHHETINLTSYDDDVTAVDFFHTTSSGGDPYKLSDNISSVVSNCWYSDDYTGTYIYEWILDSKYKLLLHMEDAGLSDSSLRGHVVTVSGVARSSTRYKFGDYAAYWDGTLTYYMAVSASLDWNLGTGDFTIHWWVNYVDYNRPGSTDYLFYWNNDNHMRIVDTGAMYLELGGIGQTSTEKLNQNNVWFHVAVVKSGGTVKLYKDGKATSTSFSVGSLDLSGSPFYIGSGGGSGAMHGYIDEFEIVEGEALWTTDFPLPEAPSEPVFINTIPGVESVIDFGRGSEDYNLVSTEYIHYDDGHTGYYNASKLSNSNDDEYFRGTTTSGYVCIDWADDNVDIGCLSVKARSGSLTGMIKNFTFLGGYKDPRFSVDSDWTILYSGTFQQELIHQPIYFANENPYRYYKLDIIDTYGSTPVLQEWKMYKYEPLYRPMTVSQLRLNPVAFDSQEVYFPKQIELQVSNNMIDWTTVLSATSTATPFYDYAWNRWQRFSFENIIGYYNYKLICYGNWNDHAGPVAIAEWEMVEKSSEAYTHRVLATASDNLNSIWASPTTTFDGGFIYIGDHEVLNAVYNNILTGSTVVSGVLDINLI